MQQKGNTSDDSDFKYSSFPWFWEICVVYKQCKAHHCIKQVFDNFFPGSLFVHIPSNDLGNLISHLLFFLYLSQKIQTKRIPFLWRNVFVENNSQFLRILEVTVMIKPVMQCHPWRIFEINLTKTTLKCRTFLVMFIFKFI